MPGLLSTMFADDGGNGETQNSQSESVAADGGADVSPSVDIGLEAGGSYENADGSTTTWSSDTEMSGSADVGATFGAVADLDQISDG